MNVLLLIWYSSQQKCNIVDPRTLSKDAIDITLPNKLTSNHIAGGKCTTPIEYLASYILT